MGWLQDGLDQEMLSEIGLRFQLRISDQLRSDLLLVAFHCQRAKLEAPTVLRLEREQIVLVTQYALDRERALVGHVDVDDQILFVFSDPLWKSRDQTRILPADHTQFVRSEIESHVSIYRITLGKDDEIVEAFSVDLADTHLLQLRDQLVFHSDVASDHVLP